MFSGKDRSLKILLVIIALLLLMNLFKSFTVFPRAIAQEVSETGRYQISIWSVEGNESSFNPNGYYGYYIIDTQTGRIVDERVNNL